ncbi:Protein CBG07544 [Caenorhabditis briggsae]|uniref:Protein CBG07544 n=1 Tax=Caenorhabditis briggsae TaxID=6238 RepID=A8X4L4_CAEBR|nr:Protein CBG07544 [Caenorhabditis briggsae]CAP27574.2 Protein CBG07544 [Caenorhabditis briggsae]
MLSLWTNNWIWTLGNGYKKKWISIHFNFRKHKSYVGEHCFHYNQHFGINSTKARFDELNSSLENERRSRKLEKAAHSQQKAEWDAEKEGIDQMADNFSDDIREQADLVKSLKKERDSLRMEMDAEKKCKGGTFQCDWLNG